MSKQWVLCIDGYYWNGRGPICRLFESEDKAMEELYAYVDRNWDSEMGDIEKPEDEDEAVREYFSGDSQIGESYMLGRIEE